MSREELVTEVNQEKRASEARRVIKEIEVRRANRVNKVLRGHQDSRDRRENPDPVVLRVSEARAEDPQTAIS